MRITEGKPDPLGGTWDGRGVNFSVFSSVAEKIDVCLFDEKDREERVTLPGRTGDVFHGYVPSIGPGKRYGFRVHGPWDPARGCLCGPERLLLDPYARAVFGSVQWDDSLFPVDPGDLSRPASPADTAPFMPKSVVIDSAFDWQDDRPPRTALEDTVIYETHVKGITQLHPGIPREIRGTYAGLAHPACLEHLDRLGVTAVELLPVHQFMHRRRLTLLGLRNYWGYDPVVFFAPHNEYASDQRAGAAVREFKEMVRALHGAGLEVYLDVVFNHTCEGGTRGAVLSFKGFDNRVYYRLSGERGLEYVDYTGTHNTLNTESPHVRRMITDSLVYWAREMHVDGFRIDLAPVLARVGGKIDLGGDFINALRQNPALKDLKLIAEPWDIGEGGYQLGRFPAGWSEWNDKYRDEVRGFWNGRTATVEGFARRFAGSADIFAAADRGPLVSVNFATCHDGYTLHDLVSYEEKHNRANGEDNRDGHDDNRSWNCGAEGATDDPEINALRDRQKRNFLATLFFSWGVPMLLGGDEIGRTQHGNNNAYCQDNALSWFDWERADRGLADFVPLLADLRKELFSFPAGNKKEEVESGRPDAPAVKWLDSGGKEIDLNGSEGSAPGPLQLVLSAGARGAAAESGSDECRGADVVLLFNPTDHEVAFRVPEARGDHTWIQAICTALPVQPARENASRIKNEVRLISHSFALLILSSRASSGAATRRRA